MGTLLPRFTIYSFGTGQESKAISTINMHGVAVVASSVQEAGRVVRRFADKEIMLRDFSSMSNLSKELVDGDGCRRVIAHLVGASLLQQISN
jgi:glutamyl-tRNA reductase